MRFLAIGGIKGKEQCSAQDPDAPEVHGVLNCCRCIAVFGTILSLRNSK